MSWGVIRLPAQRALVFSYDDRRAGPSAKGHAMLGEAPTREDAAAAATRPTVTVRLTPELKVRPLPIELVEALGLPEEPAWLEHVRHRPPAPTAELAVVDPPVDVGVTPQSPWPAVVLIATLMLVALVLLAYALWI